MSDAQRTGFARLGIDHGSRVRVARIVIRDIGVALRFGSSVTVQAQNRRLSRFRLALGVWFRSSFRALFEVGSDLFDVTVQAKLQLIVGLFLIKDSRVRDRVVAFVCVTMQVVAFAFGEIGLGCALRARVGVFGGRRSFSVRFVRNRVFDEGPVAVLTVPIDPNVVAAELREIDVDVSGRVLAQRHGAALQRNKGRYCDADKRGDGTATDARNQRERTYIAPLRCWKNVLKNTRNVLLGKLAMRCWLKANLDALYAVIATWFVNSGKKNS